MLETLLSLIRIERWPQGNFGSEKKVRLSGKSACVKSEASRIYLGLLNVQTKESRGSASRMVARVTPAEVTYRVK